MSPHKEDRKKARQDKARQEKGKRKGKEREGKEKVCMSHRYSECKGGVLTLGCVLH